MLSLSTSASSGDGVTPPAATGADTENESLSDEQEEKSATFVAVRLAVDDLYSAERNSNFDEIPDLYATFLEALRVHEETTLEGRASTLIRSVWGKDAEIMAREAAEKGAAHREWEAKIKGNPRYQRLIAESDRLQDEINEYERVTGLPAAEWTDSNGIAMLNEMRRVSAELDRIVGNDKIVDD